LSRCIYGVAATHFQHAKDGEGATVEARAKESIGCTAALLRFESARGSLYEAQSGLRVAVAWGYFTIEQVAPTLAALDAIAKRLYGLARR